MLHRLHRPFKSVLQLSPAGPRRRTLFKLVMERRCQYSGLLKGVEAELLEFVEEWRQKGFDVNRYTLLRKAGTMVPEILQKTERNIKEASIKNAWRKTGFSWFPHLPKEI